MRTDIQNIKFTKMEASGNDFIVLNNKNVIKKYISTLCKRRTGIGADGILVIEPSEKADIKMRIFNADGSEPEMCGNGIRCVSLYAYDKRIVHKNTFNIETLSGIIKVNVNDSNITIFFTKPTDLKLDLKFENENIYFVNTGVPHVIMYTEDIEDIDISNLGRKIRNDNQFQPEGTNVDFVQTVDNSNILIRTYERGVEGETLACGTGIMASALITKKVHDISDKINVKTRHGDTIEVNTIDNSFTGKANYVFEGKIL